MRDIGFRVRLFYHVLARKLRTLLQGPKLHPEFIRAAHYFSDGWALNMLQIVAPGRITAELRAIKDDGFNTIILVVPWRGFQTDQLQPAYDAFYERQLHRVLAVADGMDLSVIVRVAYTYQIAVEHNLSGITQAQRLLIDEDTRQAWLDYLARLYRICHSHRSFMQGFISWEEFWHAFGSWQRRDIRPRRELARTTGYRDFALSQGLTDVNEIPKPGDPGHASFHAFTNHRIREYYAMARSVFPGLSMEFRVDKERLVNDEGDEWVRNDDYADHSDLRYSYWAPFMGAENVGETLDAAAAAHLLEHMLDEVSYQGARPRHVVDQFNFVDEAPKFKGVHAEIRGGQVEEFLQLAAPLLRDKSCGYGVWAYRDYQQNILFNARFLMGMTGWQAPRGRARVIRPAGVRLGSGAILRQFLPPVVSGLQRGVGFEKLILVAAMGRIVAESTVEVRINTGPWISLAMENSGSELSAEIPVDFGAIMADGLLLELRNQGSVVEVASLSLFHWVFRGGIRLEDGSPAHHYQALVAFNGALEGYRATSQLDQTA